MAEKIRVVHLINQLGRGGTERQLYLLLEHHDAASFEHRVVVFNPSRHAVWNRELAAAGVEILALPASCRGPARRLLHLWRRLRSFRPHVVHSWTLHDNPYAGILGRLLGARVRWGSLRNSLATEGMRRLPSWWRRLSLRSVSRLLVNCRALADELVDGGYPRQRILVLPNCVELPAEDTVPADLTPWGIDGDAPVVGVVSNLRPRKDLKTFVRAMAQVLPRHPDARAVLVGQTIPDEASYGAEVEAEIERLGLSDRCVVTGFCDDVPAMMARLSVLCLTSEHEGMPNVVLEAMAAGRPVVATRVGGVPEIVGDGENGYLVERGAAAAVAEAVGRLLADLGLAKELGDAGRRHAVREHGCREAVGKLESLYRKACR